MTIWIGVRDLHGLNDANSDIIKRFQQLAEQEWVGRDIVVQEANGRVSVEFCSSYLCGNN